jgi:hypothetical protein
MGVKVKRSDSKGKKKPAQYAKIKKQDKQQQMKRKRRNSSENCNVLAHTNLPVYATGGSSRVKSAIESRANAPLGSRMAPKKNEYKKPEDQWLAVQKTIGWLLEYGVSLSTRPWAVAWSDAKIAVECSNEYKATLIRLESLSHQWLSRQTAHAHTVHSHPTVKVSGSKGAGSKGGGKSGDGDSEDNGAGAAGSGHFQIHEAVAALQMLWAMDRRLRLETRMAMNNADSNEKKSAGGKPSGASLVTTAPDILNDMLVTLLDNLAQAARVGVDILPVWADLAGRAVQRLGPERVCNKLRSDFEDLATYEEMTAEKEVDELRDEMDMAMARGKGKAGAKAKRNASRRGKTDSYAYVSVRLGLKSLVHAAFHTFKVLPVHSMPPVEDEELPIVASSALRASPIPPASPTAQSKQRGVLKTGQKENGRSGRSSPSLPQDIAPERRAYHAHAVLLGGLARILPSAAKVMGTEWAAQFVGPFQAVVGWILRDALAPPPASADGHIARYRAPGELASRASTPSSSGAAAGASGGAGEADGSDRGTGCFRVRFPDGTATLHLQDKKEDNVTAGNWEALARLGNYLKTLNVPHEIYIELVMYGRHHHHEGVGGVGGAVGDAAVPCEVREGSMRGRKVEAVFDVGDALRGQAKKLEEREGRELSEEELQRAGSYLKDASYCPLVEEIALWRADAVRQHLLEQCGVDPSMVSIDHTLDRMCSRKEPPPRSLLTNPFGMSPVEGSLYEAMTQKAAAGRKRSPLGTGMKTLQEDGEDGGEGVDGDGGGDQVQGVGQVAGDLVLKVRMDPLYVLERGAMAEEKVVHSDDEEEENDDDGRDDDEQGLFLEDEEDDDGREADDQYDEGYGAIVSSSHAPMDEIKHAQIAWAPIFGYVRLHGADHLRRKDAHYVRTSAFSQHRLHKRAQSTTKSRGNNHGGSSYQESDWKAMNHAVKLHGICQRPDLAHPSMLPMVLDAVDAVDQAAEMAAQEAKEQARLDGLARARAKAKADERMARARAGDLFDIDLASEPPTPKLPIEAMKTCAGASAVSDTANIRAAEAKGASSTLKSTCETRRAHVEHQRRAGVLGGGKVVFSYHWSDRPVARMLHDGLRRRGFDCVLPNSLIKPKADKKSAELGRHKSMFDQEGAEEGDGKGGDQRQDGEAALAAAGAAPGHTSRRWRKAAFTAPWMLGIHLQQAPLQQKLQQQQPPVPANVAGADGEADAAADQSMQAMAQPVRSHVSAGCSFEQMAGASVVVVFVSTAYLMQWSCARELNFALSTGLPIVPVLVQDPFEDLRWNYTPELKGGVIGALLVGRCREAIVNLAEVLPDPRSGRLLPSCKQIREMLTLLAKQINSS